MCFQASVAALACLTAACIGLTEGYLLILGPQLNVKSSDFEADEDVMSWIGKGSDLNCGKIDLHVFYVEITGSYKLKFGSCTLFPEVRKYNTRI